MNDYSWRGMARGARWCGARRGRRGQLWSVAVGYGMVRQVGLGGLG
jgi:hypothetical protein